MMTKCDFCQKYNPHIDRCREIQCRKKNRCLEARNRMKACAKSIDFYREGLIRSGVIKLDI